MSKFFEKQTAAATTKRNKKLTKSTAKKKKFHQKFNNFLLELQHAEHTKTNEWRRRKQKGMHVFAGQMFYANK